jgi:serine/threonine protein kinase
VTADIRPGAEIAGYRIEQVIGRGGMGVVYLAEHRRLKRKVALKVLAPELAEDERFRERFVQESELAGSLDHAHIVDIFDAGDARGLLYIAMRFVDGTDLKALIEVEGPLEPERAASLISQVAGALDSAHARGLIHRDVKPANVLVSIDPDGAEHCYLTDFGLTKRPDQTTGLTKTGQFMGSVDYAAPEQFEGKPLDARTDVYSLACVAYECLTGEVPFPRDQEAAVMYAHLRDSPPKVSSVRPGVPSRMDAAVARGMAKKPEARFPSAGALASALRGTPTPSVTGPSRGGRRRAVVVGAILVPALAVAATLLFLRPGSTPSPGASPSAGGSPTAANGAGSDLVGVLRLDPATGDRIEIPMSLARSGLPFAKSIVTGDGFVWLYDEDLNTLYKISPQTNKVINSGTVSAGAGLAFGNRSLWLPPGYIDPNGGSMVRLDPTTVSLVDQISIPPGCCVAVAYGEGSVWALGSSQLVRVDPNTGHTDVIDAGGTDLSIGGGRVWVLDSVIGQLLPVDPATDEIGEAVALRGDPLRLAATADAVWVANRDGSVDKHPLTGNSGIDTIGVGSKPNDIVVDGGAVWVACYGDGTVWKLDPLSGEADRIDVGGHPTRITVDANGVWVVMERQSVAFG